MDDISKMDEKGKGLNLIYVHHIGTTAAGDHLYEFLFSDNPDSADGENWSLTPAGDYDSLPYDDFITETLSLKSREIHLEVLHKSQYFSFLDGYDKVVALAWENLEEADYPIEDDHVRLVFHYGESRETVLDRLYERDLVLRPA